MEKVKRIVFSLLFLIALLPLTSCQDKIVVNNAFVYLVHDSCYSFGSIQGEQWQSVYVGEYSKEVVAVPKNGYKFVEWSDGLTTPNRNDFATNDNYTGPVVYYAYFEVDNG